MGLEFDSDADLACSVLYDVIFVFVETVILKMGTCNCLKIIAPFFNFYKTLFQ